MLFLAHPEKNACKPEMHNGEKPEKSQFINEVFGINGKKTTPNFSKLFKKTVK